MTEQDQPLPSGGRLPDASEGGGQRPDHGQWVAGLRALLHAVDHAWQALATQAGMTLNDVVTLELLRFTDQVSTAQLRRRTGISASAATGLIDRLERGQLVRRVRPPHNRRLVLIELTEQGEAASAALFRPLLNVLDQSAITAGTPPLAEQLRTIHHLIALFERAAVLAPPESTESTATLRSLPAPAPSPQSSTN